MNESNRTIIAILKVLDGYRESVVGSREISRQLKQHGVDLTERTVRYHLKIMDERGLTEVFGKEGRKITAKGIKELSQSYVSDRVGFIISKIEGLSYQMNFDMKTLKGNIILNASFIPEKSLADALKVMKPVFRSPFVMSDRIVIRRDGEKIGDVVVPPGMVGVGTVCSVTINGIFLKAGIPVVSKYGGLLQAQGAVPSRFVALISYDGSSLDPIVVFIKSRMTSVADAVKGKTGSVLASFREIPVVSVEEARGLQESLNALGIGGIIAIGNPNQPLYEVPVSMDKAGMVVVGGLNPVAAVEEAGIETKSVAMAILCDYSELEPFEESMASHLR